MTFNMYTAMVSQLVIFWLAGPSSLSEHSEGLRPSVVRGAPYKTLILRWIPVNLCKWIASFLTEHSIKVAENGFWSEYMFVNAGVRQSCVLFPTLVLLYISDILVASVFHYYTNDSTVDAICFGSAGLSRNSADQWKNKLFFSMEASFGNVSSWAKMVQFNSWKTWFSALTTQKTLFAVSYKTFPLLQQLLPAY